MHLLQYLFQNRFDMRYFISRLRVGLQIFMEICNSYITLFFFSEPEISLTYVILDTHIAQYSGSSVVVNITCHTNFTDGIPKCRILHDGIATVFNMGPKPFHHEQDMGFYYRSTWSELFFLRDIGMVTCEVQDKHGSYTYTSEQQIYMLSNDEALKPYYHDQEIGFYYQSSWLELITPRGMFTSTREAPDNRAPYTHTQQQKTTMFLTEETSKPYHHKQDTSFYYESAWSEWIIPRGMFTSTTEFPDKRWWHRHTAEQTLDMSSNGGYSKPYRHDQDMGYYNQSNWPELTPPRGMLTSTSEVPDKRWWPRHTPELTITMLPNEGMYFVEQKLTFFINEAPYPHPETITV